MKLPLPDLDDRPYADLVSEGLAMLPRHAPEWTNHNASDPGVTLIELLAYFTEMLLYQLNCVSRETKIEFIQLLKGSEEDWRGMLQDVPGEKVDEILRDAVLALREPQRAVTAGDFEYLARKATADQAECEDKVARACCVSRRNLDAGGEQRGHVSVVVVPERPLDAGALARLLERVREFLAPRCLLTTRLHVSGPCFIWLSVSLVVRVSRRAFHGQAVRGRIDAQLARLFGSYPGEGPDGQGWPFGGTAYLADIIAALVLLEEIERVEEVRIMQAADREGLLEDERSAVGLQIGTRSTLGKDARLGVNPRMGARRVLRSHEGRLSGISLQSHELVRVVAWPREIRLLGLPVLEEFGDTARSQYEDGE